MSFIGGMSRPARGTGLALLAVAVIAAVIGGVTLLTGDGDGGDGGMAGPPAGTSPPAGGDRGSPDQSPGPGATSAPGTTTSGAPSPGGTSTPGDAATSQPDAPGGNGQDGGNGDGRGATDGEPRGSVNGVSVRVYNNSNVADLASSAARDLREQGWQIAEVSNYPWGIVPATTAYYRPGTQEKEAARSLASSFGMRVEPRFEGIKDASGGVIIIVTKNYDGPTGKSG